MFKAIILVCSFALNAPCLPETAERAFEGTPVPGHQMCLQGAWRFLGGTVLPNLPEGYAVVVSCIPAEVFEPTPESESAPEPTPESAPAPEPTPESAPAPEPGFERQVAPTSNVKEYAI